MKTADMGRPYGRQAVLWGRQQVELHQATPAP